MKRIAYIVSRFPVATETFILREVDRVDRVAGVEVELFSLFPGERRSVHPAGERWLAALHRGRARDVVLGPAWWLVHRPARLLGMAGWVVRSHAAQPRILVRALITVAIASAHARRIAALEVEHVHASWATYPALAAWVCWRLTGVPYSFTGHAHDLFIHQLGLERKLRDARTVVTISQHNRRFLAAYGGDSANVQIVHCGIDLGAYRFRPRGPRPRGPVRALCVASFDEFKGHRYLVEAMADRGGPIDRLHVDLVGTGPLREEIEQLAARHGVLDRLHFLGRLPEQAVAERLDHADLVVLPSIVARNHDTEGIPNALIEAMAAGVPVVSTRVSGIPELVIDGETGLLADPQDAPGLREAIERTLAHPLAARERTIAGRRLVEEEFDLEAIAGRMVGVFVDGVA
jgi:glycosyltransferase involved in cell wall biosynthesis